MPLLHLLRHGTLPPNPEHRFIGQRDLPLSDEGRRQALFWRHEFSGIPLTEVWTSDLSRCRETTAIVMKQRKIPVRADASFREISLGRWEGLTKAEVEERFPGAVDARGRDFWNYVPHGGESFAMLSRRVRSALFHHLAGLAPEDSALLVAHAGVNRVILMHYMALGMEDFFDLPQPYGACTTLVFSADEVSRLRPVF